MEDVSVMTYSILAADGDKGEIGGAVASRFPAVAAYCLYLGPGAGIISQGLANPILGHRGRTALRKGEQPGACLDRILADDPHRQQRQTLAIDARGRTAVRTGDEVHSCTAEIVEEGLAIAGNTLADPGVIDDMLAAWSRSAGCPLAERLLRTLLAGEAAGGDRRGMQAAGIQVFGHEIYPEVDLRVDDCTGSPAQALRNLHRTHCRRDVQVMRRSLPTGTLLAGGATYPQLPDLNPIFHNSSADQEN